MNKIEILEKIYPLYCSYFNTFELFGSGVGKIGEAHNEYVEKAFMIASLRIVEADELKNNYPGVANLLYYIATETLSNWLAYFKKTDGIKHTDFKGNQQIERNINKTREFCEFLNKHCLDKSKNEIQFKKTIDGGVDCSTFKEALHYLYQKNRCWIVHKGIFRLMEDGDSITDVFIDEKGNKCTVSIKIIGSNLTEWLRETVRGSFVNFLVSVQNV